MLSKRRVILRICYINLYHFQFNIRFNQSDQAGNSFVNENTSMVKTRGREGARENHFFFLDFPKTEICT
jgi:hypothetical protein